MQPIAHRNGYERVTVKTTAGALERPRVRKASALEFASEIVGKGVARTHALEALVIAPHDPTKLRPTPNPHP